MGEHALLHADEEDDRELQPLGRVQRDQRDRLGRALHFVHIGDEGHVLEEAGEVGRLAAGRVLVLGHDGAQLEHVLQALLAALVAIAQVVHVAALLEHVVEQVREGAVALGAHGLDGMDEAADGGGRAGGDAGDGLAPRRRLAGVPDGEARGPRVLREARQRRIADAPRGHVDDAQQARLVEAVMDQPQVGDEILDLAPLVEAHAPDQAVGDAVAHERVLDGARLRIRAVEHGDLAQRAVRHREALGLARDELALLLVVVGLVLGERLAVRALRPEGALDVAAVVFDDRAGGVEDRLRRAVVLLQQVGGRVGEVAQEVLRIARVRRPPRVDALVRVAHDADVAVALGELARERVLRRVRVLELVDEDVPVLARAPRPRLLRFAEEPHGLHEQVVEVERGGVAQALLVALVGARDDLLEVAFAAALEVVRALHLALRAGDGGEHGARRELARIDVQRLQHALHQRRLVGVVVDDVVGREADVPPVDAEPARAHRVEGAEVQLGRVLAQQIARPFAHLARGLVRERDGEDAPGEDAPLLHQPGDAVGDDARLAAAGPGEDELRPLGVLHGGALRRVQPVDGGR